jgi:hypothetical protein
MGLWPLYSEANVKLWLCYGLNFHAPTLQAVTSRSSKHGTLTTLKAIIHIGMAAEKVCMPMQGV